MHELACGSTARLFDRQAVLFSRAFLRPCRLQRPPKSLPSTVGTGAGAAFEAGDRLVAICTLSVAHMCCGVGGRSWRCQLSWAHNHSSIGSPHCWWGCGLCAATQRDLDAPISSEPSLGACCRCSAPCSEEGRAPPTAYPSQEAASRLQERHALSLHPAPPCR